MVKQLELTVSVRPCVSDLTALRLEPPRWFMLFMLNPALLLKPMLLLPPIVGRPAGEPLEKLLEAMPGLFAPLLPP